MIKVDIINSPQVQKVASIPKISKSSRNTNSNGKAIIKKLVNEDNQPKKTSTKPIAHVDVNKIKSTYSSRKSYATVRKSTITDNTQSNSKVDTYASYRKKKYAERIKTRFDLLG